MYIAARMRETTDSFRDQSMGRFPGVVGTVDGTLIRIRAPMEEPQAYVCRKKVICSSVPSNLIGVITKHCLLTNLPGPGCSKQG